MTQAAKAKIFCELHVPEPKHGSQGRKPLLLLPNAWDVASARVFEDAGFPAIGTTSAGIAAVFGYPDGQHISRELMLEMVQRIVQSVAVPVTADVEAGYNDPLLTAVKVMEAGAVGINLEDTVDEQPATLLGLSEQVAVIRSIRSQTNLVINARTDIFLAGIGDPAGAVEHSGGGRNPADCGTAAPGGGPGQHRLGRDAGNAWIGAPRCDGTTGTRDLFGDGRGRHQLCGGESHAGDANIMNRVKDKRALIKGGTNGIGLETKQWGRNVESTR